MKKLLSDYLGEIKELLSTTKISERAACRTIAERHGLNSESLRKRFERERLVQSHSALAKHAEEIGIPIDNVNYYWHKSEKFSVNVKNNSPQETYESMRDDIIHLMNQHSPSYPTIKREEIKNGHLLVLDPADIHIGKLASSFETNDDYNNNIAVNRVHEGIQGILDKSKGFNIDKILFIIGNDVLHVDSPRRTTTSGTPQDTDGMWYDNFLLAKKLYVDVIEKLTSIADVHVTFNPSNHDYMSGFFLADAIQSWFRLSNNITFDCSIAHRKYFVYHTNLIGTTHGDGAKQTDLGLLMAEEAKQHWGSTNHRYFYTHHVHHKTAKDYIGLTVESLRSPSGTDSWHHRNSFGVGGVKAVEGFIHDKINGQIARITHIF